MPTCSIDGCAEESIVSETDAEGAVRNLCATHRNLDDVYGKVQTVSREPMDENEFNRQTNELLGRALAELKIVEGEYIRLKRLVTGLRTLLESYAPPAR